MPPGTNSNNINIVAKWCPGPGIDGFYHFPGSPDLDGDGLRMLAEWGLLDVFGVEVLEEKIG